MTKCDRGGCFKIGPKLRDVLYGKLEACCRYKCRWTDGQSCCYRLVPENIVRSPFLYFKVGLSVTTAPTQTMQFNRCYTYQVLWHVRNSAENNVARKLLSGLAILRGVTVALFMYPRLSGDSHFHIRYG